MTATPATHSALRAKRDLDYDRSVRAMSELVLDPYALDRNDRAELAATVEGLLFELVARTDHLAALFAERFALKSRVARHTEQHIGCARTMCLGRAAMIARLVQLGRVITRERQHLEALGR